MPLLIPLFMRHGSYFIIVILVIPALPLQLKQHELLRSLVHQKRSMDCITLLFMEMVTAYLVAKDLHDPSKPIKKFECVGQYQTRAGSGLHNLKKHKRTGKKKNPLILK